MVGYATTSSLSSYVLKSDITGFTTTALINSALALKADLSTSSLSNYYDKTASDARYAFISTLTSYVLKSDITGFTTTALINSALALKANLT